MSTYAEKREAFDSAKKLVKTTCGLSDEGFENRFLNDPWFNKGVHVVSDLYLQSGLTPITDVADINFGLINNADYTKFSPTIRKNNL